MAHRIHYFMFTCSHCQVYLVVGGYPALSSTELLAEGASAWARAAPLPRPLWGLRLVSITVSNKVIATGDTTKALVPQID